MNITYFGHSCLLSILNGNVIKLHPLIKGNELAKRIDVDTLPAIEFLTWNTIVGCHFNTFDLIKIDKDKVLSFFRDHDINGQILTIRETKEI